MQKKKIRDVSPHRSFHVFPKNAIKRAKWLQILKNLVSQEAGKSSNHTICSDHFSERWYNPVTKLMISAAVPDLSLNHTSTTNISCKRRGISTTPKPTLLPVVDADGLNRTVAVINYPKMPVAKVVNSNIVTASQRSVALNKTCSVTVTDSDGVMKVVQVPATCFQSKHLRIAPDTGFLKPPTIIAATDEMPSSIIAATDEIPSSIIAAIDEIPPSIIATTDEIPSPMIIDDDHPVLGDWTSNSNNLVTPKQRNRKLNNLGRSDFTSDAAWNTYRANHFATKRNNDVFKKNISRNAKKHIDLKKKLKNFVADLKSKNDIQVAEYLELTHE